MVHTSHNPEVYPPWCTSLITLRYTRVVYTSYLRVYPGSVHLIPQGGYTLGYTLLYTPQGGYTLGYTPPVHTSGRLHPRVYTPLYTSGKLYPRVNLRYTPQGGYTLGLFPVNTPQGGYTLGLFPVIPQGVYNPG